MSMFHSQISGQTTLHNQTVEFSRLARWEHPDQGATPDSISTRNGTDAAPSVEKDGTGIGAGFDMDCHPVLGAWSGRAQDVAEEHGRSGIRIMRWNTLCGPLRTAVH
jgi:hypothetical protein